MGPDIQLDTDAYSFADAYAHAKGLHLSAAVSELLRQRASMPEPTSDPAPRLKMTPQGYFVVATTGRTITPDTVKEYSEDDRA